MGWGGEYIMCEGVQRRFCGAAHSNCHVGLTLRVKQGLVRKS